jgi:site-specific recombinase XerD
MSQALTRLEAPNAEVARGERDLIALAVVAWLDSKQGRSGSTRTYDAYAATLADARAALVAVNLDLDGNPRAVALALQGWSRQSKVAGRTIKPATVAQRLAVMSSFYEFVIRRGLLDLTTNAATLVDRPKVESYAEAKAIDSAQVRCVLTELRRQAAGTDTAADLAARDLALLRVALTTGRRVAELAALRWRDVEVAGGAGITLTVRRAKGGKVMRDALAPSVSADLLTWLHRHYGAELGQLDKEAALWPALRHGGRAGRARLGEPLNVAGIAELVARRLDTHPHALRHSFAHGMRKAGAKDSEVQARLGHSNLATTGRYLAQLDRAENPFAHTLADMFDGE